MSRGEDNISFATNNNRDLNFSVMESCHASLCENIKVSFILGGLKTLYSTEI